MLTLDGCRARQHRALTLLEQHRCDLLLTANSRTAYYFSGVLSPADSPVIFALWADGTSLLVTPARCGAAAADEVVYLETYSIDRSITHPAHDAAALLRDALARKGSARPSRCAMSVSVPAQLRDVLAGVYPHLAFGDATDIILALRKRKEEDEIAEIRASLRYCTVAYRAAREIIAPGCTEIDVYNAMHAAIVRQAGTVVSFPGDFACGVRSISGGGPPSRQILQLHDLYPLDLFPAPAYYFGDTCRTFSVGPPTDRQLRAWELVTKAMSLAESMIKPGVYARDVYAAVKEFLDGHAITEKSFWHHAGHGIGHHGHEAPRIIPGTGDIFEVGDVFTLEPGVYTTALQGGIRLEDNYVLRENGLENLFDFPLALA